MACPQPGLMPSEMLRRPDLPLLAASNMSVNIVEESGLPCEKPRTPREEGKEGKAGVRPVVGVACQTICFRPKHSAQSPEAGLLTCRSLLRRLAFPFRRTVADCAGRSLLTVAGPCGILTRFPFHSPSTASTSGRFQTNTGRGDGQPGITFLFPPKVANASAFG